MEDTTERRLLNLRLRYEGDPRRPHRPPPTAPCSSNAWRRRSARATTSGSGCATSTSTASRPSTDSLGHAAGDRLLVEVADRLQSCATAPGEMVARLGGDEFVALTTGPDTEREVDELAAGRTHERAHHPRQHRRP
ncbi:diguanylate cyclase domain-containing protein [Streptomyces sp. L7]